MQKPALLPIAGMIMCVAILTLQLVTQAQEKSKDDDETIVLTLEKISAPFDPKAKVYVEQKGGKMKEYAPADHEKFDKEVEEADLEITELHIKDRRIVKIVFGKKLR
jgi:hypothetical protein